MPEDHCPGPYKTHGVPLSPTPLPLATDDHVLLLLPPEVPLCWDAFTGGRGCTHSPLTVAFPIPLPRRLPCSWNTESPPFLPSLLSLSTFPAPGSISESAVLSVSQCWRNHQNLLLRGYHRLCLVPGSAAVTGIYDSTKGPSVLLEDTEVTWPLEVKSCGVATCSCPENVLFCGCSEELGQSLS